MMGGTSRFAWQPKHNTSFCKSIKAKLVKKLAMTNLWDGYSVTPVLASQCCLCCWMKMHSLCPGCCIRCVLLLSLDQLNLTAAEPENLVIHNRRYFMFTLLSSAAYELVVTEKIHCLFKKSLYFLVFHVSSEDQDVTGCTTVTHS